MGWDIDRFPEGEVNLELICCICTCILEDPVESPCRHVFCSQCIKTWLSNQKSCPSCRAPVHKKDLQPVVPLLRNIISKQRIFCENKEKGCKELVALEILPSHIASCMYGLTPCTNEGCKERVMRKDLCNHSVICLKRTVMCEQGCEMFLTLGEKSNHNCIRALKQHFQDTTNELLGRISKLEEVVNSIFTKSNTHKQSISTTPGPSSTTSHNDPPRSSTLRGGVCSPYQIPSPHQYGSRFNDEPEVIDTSSYIDNFEYDSVNETSDHSDQENDNDSPTILVQQQQQTPIVQQPSQEHESMSPVYESRTITGRHHHRGNRTSDHPRRHHLNGMQYQQGSQQSNNSTVRSRSRSRSPYGNQTNRISSYQNQQSRRRGNDTVSITSSPRVSRQQSTSYPDITTETPASGRHSGEPLVLRIGVSSQTVSDSSSSTTTDSSESESD